MSKCKKYRIVEFPYNGKSVFRAEKKRWFWWATLDYKEMGFHRLNWIPNFQLSKEESQKLIDEDKAAEVDRDKFEKEVNDFKCKFGPVKYHCAD